MVYKLKHKYNLDQSIHSIEPKKQNKKHLYLLFHCFTYVFLLATQIYWLSQFHFTDAGVPSSVKKGNNRLLL